MRFFQKIQARRVLKRLPLITLYKKYEYYKPPTSPNPNVKSVVKNYNGDKVGYVAYGLSPINDFLYLYEIDIDEKFRRQKYATAILFFLSENYNQPIIPVHETFTSGQFWNHARKLESIGIIVQQSISVSDLDEEKERWKHLKEDQDRLKEVIHKRLYIDHEPWDIATGRGLE